MSVALLVVLLTGAVCLGMASALLPSARRAPEEPLYEDDFFDVGGPVIDMAPAARPLAERAA